MTLVSFDSSESLPVIPVVTPKRMLSVEQIKGQTKVCINSSSLSVKQECPRKAELLLKDRWRSDTTSPALVFGSGIHKALEVYYSAPLEERIMVILETLELAVLGRPTPGQEDNLLVRAVRAFAKICAPLEQLPDTDKRSLRNGAWILWHYFKTYLNDPYIAYVDEQGPFVERTFTFRLFEDETLAIDYFGTIDIAFQHTGDGTIHLADHKTASSFGFSGASYFDRGRPNAQYSGYMLGAREAFGLDTKDFIINILEVKARPKTARGSAPSFPRQITSRDETDYAEFRDVVIYNVRDYLELLTLNKNWPMGSVSMCDLYGGCTYRAVCAAPAALRENILNAKFVR
jgi:hypothetical protein